MSYELRPALDWATVVYSTPKGEGGIQSDTALLLFAIALRHPRIGGVVWKSKDEFLDEMLLATGLSKEKASAALVEANKCGLLQFVRIQGEGHWQMQLTWPPTAAAQSEIAIRWEAATPPTIYKVRDLSAQALLAAVEENSGGTDTDTGGDGVGAKARKKASNRGRKDPGEPAQAEPLLTGIPAGLGRAGGDPG